jgi:hypothetical protein
VPSCPESAGWPSKRRRSRWATCGRRGRHSRGSPDSGPHRCRAVVKQQGGPLSGGLGRDGPAQRTPATDKTRSEVVDRHHGDARASQRIEGRSTHRTPPGFDGLSMWENITRQEKCGIMSHVGPCYKFSKPSTILYESKILDIEPGFAARSRALPFRRLRSQAKSPAPRWERSGHRRGGPRAHRGVEINGPGAPCPNGRPG